ncbi:MAG TPA: DNA sulfur modification protein DndB [Verrucomicrobiae bacterium]|nr:DNA sulfur modification protein DndB [Verrucomicrobiae bacterium]
MNTESNPKKTNVDDMIAEDRARTERRKLMLVELLQEAMEKKGYVFVQSSAMGKTLSDSKSPKLVPSYSATHTLEWIADKIKLGSHMPFMETKIDKDPKSETYGRLQIDEENAEEVKQRAPDWSRQPALAAYLAQSGRKFGPIIAVVHPDWVMNPKHENWDKHGRALKSATEFTALDLEGKIGLLNLQNVLIYALDGQHRVIGIQGIRDVRDNPRGLVLKDKFGAEKKTAYPRDEFLKLFNLSLEELNSLLNETMVVEYIPAVIAGETREEASRRIRYTFISINSYAKKTDAGENILLDETDGYAILARKAGIYHPLFNFKGKNNRVNWKNSSIPAKRTEWYTTLQAIRDMGEKYVSALDKDRAKRWDAEFSGQMPIRPSEKDLEGAKIQFFEFLDFMHQLPVFQTLERGNILTRAEDVERWREFPTADAPDNKGHLLLRPIGQTILANAVGQLIKSREDGGKGMSLEAVFKKLKRLDEQGGFEAHRPQSVWYGVTYDPKKEKMIMGNQSWAHDLLIYLVSGMDESEREELWVNFVTARIVNKETSTWMNLEGKEKKFDLGRQELPAPI